MLARTATLDLHAVVIGTSLVILAGLAWAYTAAMAAMPACPAMTHLGPFLVMWTIMMAAMMFPAVVPVVVAYVALARGRGLRTTPAAVLFVAGYMIVWGLLGLPARAVLAGAEWLGDALPGLARAAGPLGGAALVACGIYQMTPLKDACLRHCRVPHLFLGQHWRDGLWGTLRLGAHHGLFCAGCCLSLMIVLLVVGVMNLAWMVGLSAVIYLEKIVPEGRLVGRVTGVALCGAGLWRIIA
jgi:predicted metal-binding membrane protein